MPSVCYFDLFLGFEGDIAKHGATRSNRWFYESWDTSDGVWTVDSERINMAFISFSSLKNPAHDPGPTEKHAGDVMLLADWSSVAKFADGGANEHPDEWVSYKHSIESMMQDFFKETFPDLVPLFVYYQLGTPLATAEFTGHEKGGFYGVETSPRRMVSDALNTRTPVPGLFLAGQDVLCPGIAGALAGGMFGAGAVDPRVMQNL